jgi:hypothetical protein
MEPSSWLAFGVAALGLLSGLASQYLAFLRETRQEQLRLAQQKLDQRLEIIDSCTVSLAEALEDLRLLQRLVARGVPENDVSESTFYADLREDFLTRMRAAREALARIGSTQGRTELYRACHDTIVALQTAEFPPYDFLTDPRHADTLFEDLRVRLVDGHSAMAEYLEASPRAVAAEDLSGSALMRRIKQRRGGEG